MTTLPASDRPRAALVVRRPGSEADLGPFLDVVTWILLVTGGLAVLTRLVTKRALRRRLDVDDVFAVTALLTSIGAGVAVSVQTQNGLGRDIGSLSEKQIVAYEKGEYANKLLYIATLMLAKLSIISLLINIVSSDLHRSLGVALTGIIASWGIVSMVVGALQCGPHEPWRFLATAHECGNLVPFWRAVSVLNMLTDLLLIIFPLHILFALQMSFRRKITIFIFFGARSLDIAATAIHITYIPAFASHNPTRDLWRWTLTAQIISCITILTSCVPYLRPVFEALPSGLYGADELRRRGTPSKLGYSRDRSKNTNSNSDGDGGYKLSSGASFSRTREQRQKTSAGAGPATGLCRFVPMLSAATSHANSASGLPGGPRRTDGQMDVAIEGGAGRGGEVWDAESTGSRVKIVKTTVVCAEWEDVEDGKEGRGESEEIEMVEMRGGECDVDGIEAVRVGVARY